MNIIKSLFEFIEKSPTSAHVAFYATAKLTEAGYTEICEGSAQELADGGKYFVRRGGAIIAFRMREQVRSFNITASHSDSPAFRLRHDPDVHGVNTTLNVESYGGTVNYTWFDRPLALAGSVMVSDGSRIDNRLVFMDEDVAVIPGVAPHLMSGINTSFSPNPAVDMRPLYSIGEASLLDAVASRLGIDVKNIVSHELYLVNRARPTLFGAENELILAPRIDDLASVYTALEAFIAAPDTDSVPMLCIFDHEEIGSATKEGAASDMLSELLSAICPDKAKLNSALAASLMLSADGAHALHPNHPELSDPTNRPVLGAGVAIKYSARRKYATDVLSDALLRSVASRAGIPIQTYANRADLPGGSTLGSIAAVATSLPTVDIGIPQLAMHSVCETCAAADVESMYQLLFAFYSSVIEKQGDAYIVK